MMLKIAFVLLVLVVSTFSRPIKQRSTPNDVISMTFLICVNDTWGDCIATVKTAEIKPNTPWNKSDNILVGNCDHGPLIYNVQREGDHTVIDVTFFSSVIEDASHPECRITWDYQYLVPKAGGSSNSLLPGCFVADSREVVYTKGLSNNLNSMTFLICVNVTDNDCIATAITPSIKPNVSLNKSEKVIIGNCDHGPLIYKVIQREGHTFIDLTFYSSMIEDASPPQCQIKWDYSYLLPTKEGSQESLLPGCYVEDSREGWHLTYYWFYILEWRMNSYYK